MHLSLNKANKLAKVYTFLFLPYLIYSLVCYSPRKWGVDFGSIFTFGVGFVGISLRLKSKLKAHWVEYFLLYLVLYSFFLFSYTGFKNWQENGYYFLKLFRTYCVFYLLYFFNSYFSFTKSDFIRLFFYVFGVHFLLVFLQYFPSLEWRLFFLKLNPIFDPQMNPLEFNLYMVGGTRVKGAMMGFDSAGIIMAYVTGLGLLIFRGSYLRLIFLALGFIGVLITSRTGAIVYLGITTFYLIGQFINNNKVFLKEFFMMLCFLLISIFVLFNFYSSSALVTRSIPKTFRFMINYQKNGKLRDESLDDTLKNHMIIAEKDLSLFGHPEHQVSRADGKIISAGQSDCGYLQILANFGIPNLILIVGIHFFLLYKLLKKSISLFDMRIIFLIMFLIACVKGPYFFGRMTYDLIVLIFYCEFLDFKDAGSGIGNEFLI